MQAEKLKAMTQRACCQREVLMRKRQREGGNRERSREREGGGEREMFLACKETAERKIAFCVLLRCWCCSSCVDCLGAETSKQAKCYQHAIISSGSRQSSPCVVVPAV